MVINKGGSSHFEIIISFVLFVGFALFLILALEPTSNNLLEESILFNIQNTFFVNNTVNLTHVLVDTTGNNCPGGNWENSRICRPDEIGWTYDAVWLQAGDKPCRFYVFTSSEFVGKGSSQLDSNPADKCDRNDGNKNYSLGYIYREEVLSNKTLSNFRTLYETNYGVAKTWLGVPNVVDFAIDSSDDSFDLRKTAPDESEVLAGTYRKKVLYSNGSIVNQDFTIKIW